MEYSITETKKVPGVPNPPQLENQIKKDVIVQVDKAEVDILWVIDNSCSMAAFQTSLVNNFDSFISYFVGSGLDWHIGVTSTDMDPGEEPGTHGILRSIGNIKFIDENISDPVAMFRDMATLGTRGSGYEKGRGAAYSAIATHNGCEHNRDFYREDASLSIIVISDEEDYSADEPLLNEFISWLAFLKEDPDDVSFSSIVCLDTQPINGVPCSVGNSYAPSVGSEYMTVTNAIGGILWDIREDDWGPVLDKLGLQAAGLRNEFFLTEVPLIRTLDVYIEIPNDPQPGETIYEFSLNEDYTYNPIRNSISFINIVPPQYTKINISYIPLTTYYGIIDTASDTAGE